MLGTCCGRVLGGRDMLCSLSAKDKSRDARRCDAHAGGSRSSSLPPGRQRGHTCRSVSSQHLQWKVGWLSLVLMAPGLWDASAHFHEARYQKSCTSPSHFPFALMPLLLWVLRILGTSAWHLAQRPTLC